MNNISIMAQSTLMSVSMIAASHAGLHQWTGLYVGAEAGAVFNHATLHSQHLGFTNLDGTCNTHSDNSTASPGTQLGYLHQFTNGFVSGIDATISYTINQTNHLDCNCPVNADVTDHFSLKHPKQYAIKGREGHIIHWNNTTLLPYVTAGASFANIRLTYTNEGGDYYSNPINQSGWLVGAGIEWPFKDHWSLRTEYSYSNYGKAIDLKLPSIYGLMDLNGNAHAILSSNSLMVSVNYWV